MTRRVLWMQAASGDTPPQNAAIDDRQLLTAVFNQPGICNATGVDLKVSQRSAGANFSVDIAPGVAVVRGTDAPGQGLYVITSDAIENVTVPVPPASGSRTHRVVAQVRDKLHNSSDWSTYDWVPMVLEDTGSGTPDVPDSALDLGTVTVAAAQVSVTDTNITDRRVSAVFMSVGLGRYVSSDAGRPPVPWGGELIWRTDLLDYQVWDGSQWRSLGLNPPAARLARTATNQSIPNSTQTALQWNSELEDTHNGHDNSTNPSRYTAPVAGLYLVTATVTWDQNASGIREIGLRVNGSVIYDGTRVVNSSNITHVQSVSHLIRLAVGDYVEATVWQNTGGALAVDRTFHSGPLMEIAWLRP